MKETIFIFCLALNLLVSSAVAGETADYLSSKEAFLEAYPDAVEIQPGVYQVAVDESRIRTYAFGSEGMRYQLERMRGLILDDRRTEKSAERSELEDAYWTLSEKVLARDENLGLNAEESGVMCTVASYQLEAVAWTENLWNPYGEAFAGFHQDGVGPPSPYGPVTLFAYATASNEFVSVSDGGTDGPHSLTGFSFISTDAYAEAGYSPSCQFSDASAWIYIENCPDGFRSVDENFVYPPSCS